MSWAIDKHLAGPGVVVEASTWALGFLKKEQKKSTSQNIVFSFKGKNWESPERTIQNKRIYICTQNEIFSICSDSKQSQSSICPEQEEGPSWKVYDGKYFSKYLSETEKKYLSDAETLPQQGADQGWTEVCRRNDISSHKHKVVKKKFWL